MLRTPISRRALLAGSAAAGLSAQTRGVMADTYPSHPIKLVCPFAAGGTPDIFARTFAIFFGQRVKQQVYVENIVGATGTIAAAAVARADPDGYTLLLGSTYPNGNAQFLRSNLPYNVDTDFAMISSVSNIAFALTTPPTLPVRTVKELIDHAAKNPGALHYASSGPGNLNNIAVEVLKARYNVDITHVPYRSGSQAILDTTAGRVELMLMALATAAPRVASGQLRALAVTGPTRTPLMPDVPTMIEAGVSGFTAEEWFGLLAPAKIPADIRAALEKSAGEVVNDPEFQAKMESVAGSKTHPMVGKAFETFVKGESAKWRDVIRSAGIKGE